MPSSYPAYKLVQVKFPTSTRLYTYLYPDDWNIRVGDSVAHPGMYGPDYGTVARLGADVYEHQIPLRQSLFVLTDHTPRPRFERVTVDVPEGCVVKVVPRD